MRYYLAIAFEGGTHTIQYGSASKSDVDYEVQDWKEQGCKSRNIHRKTFQHIPTQREIDAFAKTFSL